MTTDNVVCNNITVNTLGNINNLTSNNIAVNYMEVRTMLKGKNLGNNVYEPVNLDNTLIKNVIVNENLQVNGNIVNTSF